MIKLLSIGNSFSQDAQRWLYDICAEGGEEELYHSNQQEMYCKLKAA